VASGRRTAEPYSAANKSAVRDFAERLMIRQDLLGPACRLAL